MLPWQGIKVGAAAFQSKGLHRPNFVPIMATVEKMPLHLCNRMRQYMQPGHQVAFVGIFVKSVADPVN